MPAVKAGHHLVLKRPHRLLLLEVGVVVAQEVQGAVNREQDELLEDAPLTAGGLPHGLVHVEHEITEQHRARRRDVVIGEA